VVVFVVEALRFTDEDELALRRAKEADRPVVAVVNKVDRVADKTQLLPFLAQLSARHPFVDVVPLSANDPRDAQRLAALIAKQLPESPPLFPEEQLTDRSESFRIAEVIREKLTLELNQEVPYGVAVEVEGINTEDDGQKVVSAIIWVDREGQKPIVIGAGGERLKRIGTQARKELNRILGVRLHLTLWVKVREDWADNAQALRQLGLE
jgi:GTP-binding protein Era